MDLFDSNIIIYAADPVAPASILSLLSTVPCYSRISELEIFGFSKITAEEIASLQVIVDQMLTEEISPEVIRQAITLRQQKRISVPDSIMAATALLKGYRLVTRNTDDFDRITGLPIYNPFDAPPAP